MEKVLCLLMVLLCAAGAQAAILSGIPGGDFSRTAVAQAYDGGYWSYHISGNASVTLVPDGGSPEPSNYAQLQVVWYPRAANMWFVSHAATPTTGLPVGGWGVSAELMSNPGRDGCDRIFALRTQTSPGIFAPAAFSMNFDYVNNWIDWIAGSQSGRLTLPGGVTRTWTTAAIEYDPVTGAALGKFGDTTVFDVMVETGLTVDTVYFSNMTDASTYDVGTFNIDNVSSYVVPEPATLTLLALASGWALRRRR